MRSILIKTNQSLFDIALEQYGDVMGVYWLVEDNNLRSVVDVIEQGKALKIRDEYLNKRLVENIATRGSSTMEATCNTVGIGFEQLGKFKII